MRLLSIVVVLFSLSLVYVYAPSRWPFGKKTKSDKKSNNNQPPHEVTESKDFSPQRHETQASSTAMTTNAEVNMEPPLEMTKHTQSLLFYTTGYLPIDDLYELYWAAASLSEEPAKSLQTKIKNQFEQYEIDNDLTLEPDIFQIYRYQKFHVWMKAKLESYTEDGRMGRVVSNTYATINPDIAAPQGNMDMLGTTPFYYEPRVRMAVNNEFVGDHNSHVDFTQTFDSHNLDFDIKDISAETLNAIKQDRANKWWSVRFPAVRMRMDKNNRVSWSWIMNGDTKWIEVDRVELRMTNADAAERKINRDDVRTDSRGDPLIWYNHGVPEPKP